jgi:DNA-binding CsgD family transcriptional regulator
MLTGIESLTPSERRVANLAAQGMTTRKIAVALFITRKTVEYHLRNIYQKVEVSSRAELRAVLSKNRVNPSATIDAPPGVTGRRHP